MSEWLNSKEYDEWKLNPPERKESAFKCTCCGEELYPDDKYWDIEGEHYCYECATDWFNDNWHYVTEEQCFGNK